MTEEILFDRSDGIVTITLNRPARKNALTPNMFQLLGEMIDDVAAHGDDRVLVLTGAGREFCAGMDLNHFFEMQLEYDALHRKHMTRGSETTKLFNLPIPTIAKVQGVAVGLGMVWALSCDLVVATPSSRMSMIFARRGLCVEGGASWLLPRLVGLQNAKRLAMLAELLPAQACKDMGLITELVPEDKIDGFVAEWAQNLRESVPIVMSMNKLLMNESQSYTRTQAEEIELRNNMLLFHGADVKGGIDSFFSNRSRPEST